MYFQAEELRRSVLEALVKKSGAGVKPSEDSRLRAAAAAIQYEDWAIDFNMVCSKLYCNNYRLCELILRILSMSAIFLMLEN